MKISELKESTCPPYKGAEPGLDRGLDWFHDGVHYRWDTSKQAWLPVPVMNPTTDLLTDIAKKLEKTNILLARIENAVQSLEETTRAIHKNTR
jgi:hypothetical protein